MKNGLAVLVLSTVVCLALQAQAQSPGEIDRDGRPEGLKPPPAEQVPPDAVARADDLRLRGRCQQAIPIYRALAAQGAGYEISEFNLGLCLFDISNAEPDAQRAASLKHEAAEWIIKAANSDFPNAQSSLVAIYLDGTGVEKDPVEAGKWSIIYQGNGAHWLLGLPNISPELKARLGGALTEKAWAISQSRAFAWSPTSQSEDGDK